MHQVLKSLKHRLPFELKVPDYIRQEFLQESVRKNNFSLKIICGIIFATELFNIARVLFWSRSGLTTRNNQIYFSMYCILILFGVLWLVVRRPLQRAPAGLQWVVQSVTTSLILLWHMVLNTYDLYRDPAAETTVLTTALLGLSLLIQLPPFYNVAQSAASYLLFRIMMAPLMDAGDRLNLTITFLVGLAVSLAHAHHTCITLKQQKQIVEINTKLQELVQLDPLTGLLNKTAVECWAEQMLQEAEHTEKSKGLTLFLMDLGEFKSINDRYGHPCGDHVLTETAEAMRRAFPHAAALGRVGGDEFAILYDHSLSEAQATDLSHGLLEQLEKIQWENQPLKVRCSIGVCICSKAPCCYQNLYTEADRMLYHAKKNGKCRCCIQQLSCGKNTAPEKNCV